MKDDIGSHLAINRPQLDDQGSILYRVSSAAVHPYRVMDTPGFRQKMGIIIQGSYRVYFMSLGKKRTNKIHPEIVDIPGGIKNHRNFHSANDRP